MSWSAPIPSFTPRLRARNIAIEDPRPVKRESRNAASDYDPRKAIGLDGALNKLSHNSYGPFLLGVVAAGLIGFALYSIADARYRKI